MILLFAMTMTPCIYYLLLTFLLLQEQAGQGLESVLLPLIHLARVDTVVAGIACGWRSYIWGLA